MTVVALFYASAFTVYVGSPQSRPEGTDKLIALVYALLTPFLNPIIYSLRNKEVKEAVKRVSEKIRTLLRDT
jgi:olfactory receptor